MEKAIAALAALGLVVGLWLVGAAIDDNGTSATTPNPALVSATAAPNVSGAAAAALADATSPTTVHDHGAAAGVDDRGFSLLENGVQHTHAFTQPVSAADRVLLAHQLELARQVALQYPTVADAERAGLRRAGPFSPGLGAHYISYRNALANSTGTMTDDNIRAPLAWIYDGTHPNSRIAGLFYMTTSTAPTGFAGTNDQWHTHSNICIKTGAGGTIDAPLGADHDATVAQCQAVGGNLLKQTALLLHVWAVPGYESPEGVFSHLSSAITCDDGTYDTIADVTKVGSATTVCKDGTE